MSDGKQAQKRWHLSTPAIAGLLALVSGAVSLAFTLSPSWKPDPGNNINAELRVLRVEPGVTVRDLVQRLGTHAPDSLKHLEPAVLDDPGHIVYLRIKVEGRKRHKVEIQQSTYYKGSGKRFESLGSPLGFTSETPSDTWVAQLFVIDPAVDKQYFARFELYDGATILAIADTRALP